MLMVNESNNHPFAKTTGSFDEATFACSTKVGEERFLCNGEISALHKTEGMSTHHQKMTMETNLCLVTSWIFE